MKTLKEILLYIWQLPQNLLGLIMLLFMKPYVSKENYYLHSSQNVLFPFPAKNAILVKKLFGGFYGLFTHFQTGDAGPGLGPV